MIRSLMKKIKEMQAYIANRINQQKNKYKINNEEAVFKNSCHVNARITIGAWVLLEAESSSS